MLCEARLCYSRVSKTQKVVTYEHTSNEKLGTEVCGSDILCESAFLELIDESREMTDMR